MTNSGEAAEQIVRMSLEGTEVALKLTGSAAKNIAVALYAIAKNKDNTKIRGHQRLSAMLRSGKELKVFTISEEHLKCFAQEAKRYGVVYCALRGRQPSADGMVDIMVRAEDASKINRIVERFKLATVDTASIKHEIARSRAEKAAGQSPQEQAAPQKDPAEALSEKAQDAPIQKEEPSLENPTAAKTGKSPPSEPTSGKPKRADEGTTKADRPSVRKELREIKAARQAAQEDPRPEQGRPAVKQESPLMQIHQNPGRKKFKLKER